MEEIDKIMKQCDFLGDHANNVKEYILHQSEQLEQYEDAMNESNRFTQLLMAEKAQLLETVESLKKENESLGQEVESLENELAWFK